MATQSTLFELANIAGYTDMPNAMFSAGQIVSGLSLTALQGNADFGVCRFELFYDEVPNGGTVPLHQSPVDGYNYQRSEQIYLPEIRTTVDPYSGLPGAAGSVLFLSFNVHQDTGQVEILTVYYVQNGAQSNTTDGTLAIWTIGQRGRGYLKIVESPSFAPLANTSLVTDAAYTQVLAQNLNNNIRAAVPATEAFLLNSSGASSWTPNTTVVQGILIQPNFGHENGYWYEAFIVYGPTGNREPTWPCKLGAQIVDGGTVWIAVGRGAQNGNTLGYPTSPVDGYVYSATDNVVLLPFYYLTGAVQAGTQISLGPSGAGRIQRLQKSASGMTVSSAVTYWNGTGQTSTNDGLLGVMAICSRSFSGTITPVIPSYTGFSGTEFGAGNFVGDQFLQDLNNNGNFARVRPEIKVNTGIASSSVVPVIVSPVDGYSYGRGELLYLTILNDTGSQSGDYALRDIIFFTDPELGVMNSRIDYYHGGNPQATTNGTYTSLAVGFRQAETLLSGVSIIPTIGTPEPIPPGSSESIIPNGGMELWSQLTTVGQQHVGLPDGWSYLFNSAHAEPQQVPYNVGTPLAVISGNFSLALAVNATGGSPSTVNFIHVQSAPGAVTPGDPYSFSIQYYASPAISQGLYINLHFLDINLNELGYAQLVNNGPVGTGITTLAFKFFVPNAVGASLNTDVLGAVPIVGGAGGVPYYIGVELANDRPNVQSNIVFDSLNILHLVLDAVSPVNTSQSLTVLANLSQSGSTSLINVAASSLILPSKTVNYSSGSVNPGSFGTWYIYANDPQLLGGAVTYLATQDKTLLTSSPGYVTFGQIITTSSGGGSGGGGGTGGTGIAITTKNLPDANISFSYSKTLTAYGGLTPYSWSVVSGSLPTGISLNSSTGVLSGTPTTTGFNSFTVRVTDSSSPTQNATQLFALYVS